MNINVEKLETAGYVVLKNVLPKSFIQDTRKFLEEELLDSRTGFESLGEEDRKNLSHGQFPKHTRLSLSLLDIPRYLSEKNIIQKILNCEDVFLHMPPMARFIESKNSQAIVPPHQDIHYNTHAPDFYILWIPLIDIRKEIQGLVVFEGGEPEILRKGLPVLTKETDSLWVSSIDVSDFKKVDLFPLDIGDLVIMTSWVPHQSGVNATSSIRFSLDYRLYKDVQNVTKPYIKLK